VNGFDVGRGTRRSFVPTDIKVSQ